ncbi:MAG: NAD(P)H-dependent oxidoreductase [Candidatus Staskawiczbacteria bacterium]
MLIIYAHPNKDGYCGYILQNITKRLSERNINYELLDLYAMNYDPVLKAEEHYTSGHREVSLENQKIQEKIKNESRFIFIYPTWWNSTPAILKGFIDRIFTARFAYYYKNGIPMPLLSGKAVVLTSTGGPRLISKLYFKDGSVKFLTRDVLKFCGIKSKYFVIDRATKITDKQKEKINQKVENALNYLV